MLKKTRDFSHTVLYSPSIWTLHFSACPFKDPTPPKKPSLLWFASSLRSEQASTAMFLHQLCQCWGRGRGSWLFSCDIPTFWKSLQLILRHNFSIWAVDWAFWYSHTTYVTPRNALWSNIIWKYYFQQCGTFKKPSHLNMGIFVFYLLWLDSCWHLIVGVLIL